VNKLRRHSDEAVAKAATALYKKWRQHFEDFRDRPQIEVKCDTKSEGVRDSGRKLLADALDLQVCHTLFLNVSCYPNIWGLHIIQKEENSAITF
jgi:hypothetical protein